MASEILDNRGRGQTTWSWPAIHREGYKFAAICAVVSLICALMAWETLAWPTAIRTPMQRQPPAAKNPRPRQPC